ncbi:MAG: alpha amylase C-terminal domain-containing protein [Chloroflexi bacterium]|nr:alpha amylase C-terminal domain-containing protein [Chloroflexota bacterium]
MAILVRFIYHTGIPRDIFKNVRLCGDWNGWADIPMTKVTATDGCPAFEATVPFGAALADRSFRWGVRADVPQGNDLWAINLEVQDADSQDRHRAFTLRGPDNNPQEEHYFFTHCRRLGAHKYYQGAGDPGIRFSVWAPNALKVEVVFGDFAGADKTRQSGYISDYGSGSGPVLDQNDQPVTLQSGEPIGSLELHRGPDGIWENGPATPGFPPFKVFDHRPYMYRITRDDSSVRYRTDLFTRCQIGKGRFDPQGHAYLGHYKDLDGTVGCSVVIDLDSVTEHFDERFEKNKFIESEKFWAEEFKDAHDPTKHAPPLPTRIEDLVIYELHVNSLGYGKPNPGTFEDAMAFLDHLVELGINTVELLPVAEYEGNAQWGYGSSHFFALEYSAGGRDQLKHLIRACHRRGIAVIVDVVYNHFHHSAERAEWAYDSDGPDGNIYYWYEGNPSDYSSPDGGYLDNYSTGYAPRLWEEMVRQMFISSAAAIVEDFHVDGFRVDMTASLHQLNVRHADGRPVGHANQFGAKLLREWTSTLKLVKPNVFLIAEDHSGWAKVTEPPDQGGLGFDATWYADFYHHLIGDARVGPSYARLLKVAGAEQSMPLAMDYFSGALLASAHGKVVYHESHDEAGNSADSHRTIVVAVNGAPLSGDTRRYAEARCRFAFGMSMLSAGTPMFFMAEEVGAKKPYTYNHFMVNREDLYAEKAGNGANLFRFYADLISLRKAHPALRSRNIDVLHVHNASRVIAFRRWDDSEEFLVVASLNNWPFLRGYALRTDPSRLRDGGWREVFNSDARAYGGYNFSNIHDPRPEAESFDANTAHNGEINIVIPANGFVVLRKT